MKTPKRLKGNRFASALVLVVFAIVIMVLMGLGLLTIGLDSHVYAIRNSRVIAARSAADAGLAKAIYEMNKKRVASAFVWDDSTLPSATDESLPNADATYSYQITKLPAAFPNYAYTIESTGRAAFAQRTVYATTRLRSLAEYAIFVKQDLILKAGTTVSGFNSADPSQTDVKVRIGTNSTGNNTVRLFNGTTINGKLFIGAGGDLDEAVKDTGATITGGQYAQADETFAQIVPPAGLSERVMPLVKGQTVQISQADSGTYSSIDIERGLGGPGVLEVESGDVVLHVTGSMDIGQDCEIVVKAGASLTIYLAGNMVSGNNSGFVNENTPPNLKLYGIGTEVQNFDVRAKSEYFGRIYAPNADVEIKAMGNLYGAFVANSFEMKSGGNIYYDQALSFADITDQDARFAIYRWYE
jgi:hypothetical protein